MPVRCLIKYRNWDEKKGLRQEEVEALTFNDLFEQLAEAKNRNNVHSVIIEGTEQSGQQTQISLEITSLVKTDPPQRTPTEGKPSR